MKGTVRNELENLETSLGGLKRLLFLATEDLDNEAGRPDRVKQDAECLYACIDLLSRLMDELRGIKGRLSA